MQATQIFEEIQAKLGQLIANSPAKDIERNVRGLMQQGFEKLDLATREQLDLQAELLSRTRAKLTELEARIAELEGKNRPL
jgi:BMFP domain-containing protein YqiC